LVSIELRRLAAEWREAATRDFLVMLGEELQRLTVLERTYWEGWEASKRDIVQVGVRAEDGAIVTLSLMVPPRGGEDSQEQREQLPPHFELPEGVELVRYTRVSRTGDPRYLLGVQRIIAARIRLLGLDKLQP